MQEQGKNQSSGVKLFIQEQKKQKVIATASMQEQGKGTKAKSLVKHAKGARVIFSSDAERNLDGVKYRLGDMVWAKVKSHPWWPGQLYDPALASACAMEFKRDSCFLVAFFGDSTFGWFAEAELIPYNPNFVQKSRQTSAPNFVDAVEDSLDEVRRRVKLGLTCRCRASESGGQRAGLLYDRQFRDIRRTLEPAKLLTFIKQLACSPFSSSQNMFRSTVTGAQMDAFRFSVLCKKLSEQKGPEALTEVLPSNHIKAHDLDDVGSAEVSKDKMIPEKGSTKKHQPKLSSVSSPCQEQDDRVRKQSLKETLQGLVEVAKVNQHRKGVTSKKRSSEKSKDLHGDKGITEDTSRQSAECDVQGKQILSATVAKEIQESKAPCKERDIQESGQNPEQSGRDSLSTSQNKAQQRKPKKSAGLTVIDKSMVVSEVEAMELVVSAEKPNAALKKAKVSKTDGDEVSKMKTIVADVELNKAMKKVKVVGVGKDRVSKQPKRFLEDEPTKVVDVLSRQIKKRKLQAEFKDKDNSDYSLREDTGDSVASDPLPTLELPQQAYTVIRDATALESDSKCLHVESLMPEETAGKMPAEALERVLEVGQLHQEDGLRDKHVDDYAAEACDVGYGLVKQASDLEAEHTSVSSFQAEVSSIISKKNKEKVKDSNLLEPMNLSTSQAGTVLDVKMKKKVRLQDTETVSFQAEVSSISSKKNKEKVKDSNLLEPRNLSISRAGTVLDVKKKKIKRLQDTKTVELLKPEGSLYHGNDVNGQGEEESLKTSSKVIEDQTSKDMNASPTEAETSLAIFHGTSSVQSFVMCSAEENMQDVSQTRKKEASVNYGQEEKISSESTKEVKKSKHLHPSNEVSSSRKRVVEECLSKNFKAKNKRIRNVSTESTFECHVDFVAKDGEQHEGLNRWGDEITSLQNLHEGLLSLAAKPLDAIKEECYSAVHRAFTNFRKVVYKKAVCHTVSENLVTSSAAGASEGVIEVGNENDNVTELVPEQAEAKGIRDDHFVEAESSKVEDARMQEVGVSDVLVSQKQSEKYSMASALRPAKKLVTISKTPSSSSISLRPAFEAKLPGRGSKEVLNRFGQRVPRLLDAGERITSPSSRFKSYTEERVLVISFPHGFLLPSEVQLREVFSKFGALNVRLSRIDSKSGCAHIIFRHAKDAEAALNFMKENPVFENARFWLKPRDAERKEIAKQGSRNTAFSDRAVLSRDIKLEVKTASDKVRTKTTSDRGLLVSPKNTTSDRGLLVSPKNDIGSDKTKTASDRGLLVSPKNDMGSDIHIQVGDRSGVISSRKTEVSGKEGDPVSLQSNCGVTSSLNASAFQKAVGSGHGEPDGTSSIHPSVVASTLNAEPRSFDSPVAIDISEPFLALLHQLHDLVVSTGFVI